jgi:glycosyltransferase involved in cell wall biosynthesis
MSCGERVTHLRNTLTSWAGITYPDYEFFLVDNGGKDEVGVYNVAVEFSEKINNFTYWRTNETHQTSIVWNTVAKKSNGEFIVFAMQDEIISSKDILQEMVQCPQEIRCSVKNFFLSEEMTKALKDLDWQKDATIIETLPGFWDYAWDRVPNREKQDAYNLSHITGWTRERWEWFGWFRNNRTGYKWVDQDVVMREGALGLRAVTVPNVCCYHQWHGEYGANAPYVSHAPGYIYHNEKQARLLEEAERDLW